MDAYEALLARYDRLRREVEQERSREAQRIVELVVARVNEVLAAHGIAAGVAPRPVRSGQPRVPGRKAAPRYWNPKTGQTWSGRGREPAWIAGRDREAFRIPPAAGGAAGPQEQSGSEAARHTAQGERNEP